MAFAGSTENSADMAERHVQETQPMLAPQLVEEQKQQSGDNELELSGAALMSGSDARQRSNVMDFDEIDRSPRLSVSPGSLLPPKSPAKSFSPRLSPAAFLSSQTDTISPRWRGDSTDEALPLHSNDDSLTSTPKGKKRVPLELDLSPIKCELNFDESSASLILDETQCDEVEPVSFGFEKMSFIHDNEQKEMEPALTKTDDVEPTTPRKFNKVKPRLVEQCAKIKPKQVINQFYFPAGKPVSRAQNDAVLERVRTFFNGEPDVTVLEFPAITKMLGLPIYANRAVHQSVCICNGLPSRQFMDIRFEHIATYWNMMVAECHDEASRFVFTLTVGTSGLPARKYLKSDDFYVVIREVIYAYPGLDFLSRRQIFHRSYFLYVVARIFWNVTRTWADRISVTELRKSNFLEVLRQLEGTDNLADVADYFNYDAFYVAYNKFYDLDIDHDMYIGPDDLLRYCHGTLSPHIVKRIFVQAFIRKKQRGFVNSEKGRMSFDDFVEFLMADEDKMHPKAVEYWFRCLDINEDGVLSLEEMEYFYTPIDNVMGLMGAKKTEFKDIVNEMLDIVRPSKPFCITLSDLYKCKLGFKFFNAFVNVEKFMGQDTRDVNRAGAQRHGRFTSDWDFFCEEEYKRIMVHSMDNE